MRLALRVHFRRLKELQLCGLLLEGEVEAAMVAIVRLDSQPNSDSDRDCSVL